MSSSNNPMNQANLAHKAFESVMVVDKLPLTIECMTCYDNFFILGTNVGRMLIYEVKVNQQPPRKLETTFEKSITATKKPIQQLEAIKSFDILIALFDSQIHVFDLDKFQLQYSINKTKNCSLFAASVASDQKLLRLCVVCKKKLQFFYTNINKTSSNNTFMELISDLELTDIPRTLEFTKDNLIVFALKKDYYYYELPATSASLSSGGTQLEPRFSSGNRNLDPLCQKLHNDYFILGVNELQTIVYDTKGKPYLEYPILWSASPSMICSVGNYLIAILPSSNTVEIVTIQPSSSSVQLLEFSSAISSAQQTPTPTGSLSSSLTSGSFLNNLAVPNFSGLTSSSSSSSINSANKLKFLKSNGNSICYVANSSNVWFLSAIRVNEQLEQIIRQKNFELGLNLIGSQLLFNKTNECAFSKSWQSLSPPADSYFNEKNSLLKPFLSLKAMVNEVDENLHRRIKNLNALDLFAKKKFNKSLQLFQEMNTDPSHLIAFLPGLLPDGYRARLNLDEFFPVLDAKEQREAIDCLIDYLQFKRNEFLKEAKPLNDPNFTLTPLIEGRPVFKTRFQILQIIDTTLLKCYLKSKESLVPFFLRRDQIFLHFEESERLLIQHNKMSELIIFYEKKEEHEKALSLLVGESSKTNSNLAGYKHLVEYLNRLGNKHIELIFKYAKSVIESDSSWGMKIFTNGEASRIDEILIKAIKESENRAARKSVNQSRANNPKNSALGFLLNVNSNEKNNKSEPKLFPAQQKAKKANLFRAELDIDEEDDDVTKSLDHLAVYTFLADKIEQKELSMNLVRLYLQYCIYIWNDKNFNLNNSLIEVYISFIEKNYLGVKGDFLATPKTYKQMLNYYLSETESYEPSYALSKLSIESYAEERAIVLGKMGRHPEALDIYVNILNDTEKAEAYCESVYSKSNIVDSKQVFYQLLQIYLKSEFEEIRIGASIRLLNAHSNEIGTSKTLELLPAELMKCKNLSQFFENMLNRLVRTKHDIKIKNRLMIALELQVHETMIMCQDKKFTVSDEQMCKECNKRMGKSAMVRYPSGVLIHYGCLKNFEAAFGKQQN